MSDISPRPVSLPTAASDKTSVLVAYGLFLGGFLSAGLTTLVGVAVCYALAGGASDIARSHYAFLRRTFWGGVVWSLGIGAVVLVALVFAVTVIGLVVAVPLFLLAKLAALAGLVWYGARCIVGLLAAAADRPYGATRPWLF